MILTSMILTPEELDIVDEALADKIAAWEEEPEEYTDVLRIAYGIDLGRLYGKASERRL